MSRRASWARRGLRARYALDLVGGSGLSAPDAFAVLAVAIASRITPNELAELAGCSVETASRRLRDLAAAGWIVRGRQVTACYEPLPALVRTAHESVAATP